MLTILLFPSEPLSKSTAPLWGHFFLMFFACIYMTSLALLGYFSAARQHELTWEFCQDQDGNYFRYQFETGKKIAADSVDDLREQYKLMLSRTYAPCCSLVN